MKRRYKELLGFLAFFTTGLTIVVLAILLIHDIEGTNREGELIEEWKRKGAECMEEPKVVVNSHNSGKITFECPVREETLEEKTYRQVPANYFDRERRGDIDYLLQYLKDYPPTYDCALLDKYAKPNVPCWSGWGIDSIELLLNSDDKYK